MKRNLLIALFAVIPAIRAQTDLLENTFSIFLLPTNELQEFDGQGHKSAHLGEMKKAFGFGYEGFLRKKSAFVSLGGDLILKNSNEFETVETMPVSVFANAGYTFDSFLQVFAGLGGTSLRYEPTQKGKKQVEEAFNEEFGSSHSWSREMEFGFMWQAGFSVTFEQYFLGVIYRKARNSMIDEVSWVDNNTRNNIRTTGSLEASMLIARIGKSF